MKHNSSFLNNITWSLKIWIFSLLLVVLSLLKTILKQSWMACLMTMTPSSPSLPQDWTHTPLKILKLFFWLRKNILRKPSFLLSVLFKPIIPTSPPIFVLTINKVVDSLVRLLPNHLNILLNTHIILRIHCCLLLLLPIFPKSCARYARNCATLLIVVGTSMIGPLNLWLVLIPLTLLFQFVMTANPPFLVHHRLFQTISGIWIVEQPIISLMMNHPSQTRLPTQVLIL